MASKLSITDAAYVRQYATKAGISATDIEKILEIAKTVIEAIQMVVSMIAKRKA